MAKKRKRPTGPRAWTPFERVTSAVNRETRETIELDPGSELWVNNQYVVHLYRIAPDTPGHPDMLHLAITRQDQGHARDWRHLQRIKNELVGPEHEMVEVFPAESRLVDAANTLHLWGFDDPAQRVGFGFEARLVTDDSLTPGTKQRPFGPDNRPEITPTVEVEQMVKKYLEAK